MSLKIVAVEVNGNGVIYSDEHRREFHIPDVFHAGNGQPIESADVASRLKSGTWLDPVEFRKKKRVNFELWHSNTGPLKGAMMQALA